jgi:hypothetical protein
MKKISILFQQILIVISIIFTTLSIILFLVFIFNRQFFSFSGILDIDLATNFGTFFQGLVGTTACISSSLLVICVFLLQQKQEKISQLENIYYKMLDFHRENVNTIIIDNYKLWMKDKKEKAQAFVSFKLQLFDCIDMVSEINDQLNRKLNDKEIVDVAYMIFYYGVDKRWINFMKKLLINYDEKLIQLIFSNVELNKTKTFTNNKPRDLGKTNQTILSTYFRNMYNAIMLIHKSDILNKEQKKKYIRIFRAQLSNPELVIIFFNVLSRFGKKWNENNIIIEYELIKNLPTSTCNGYNPRDYYPMEYEEDEIGI